MFESINPAAPFFLFGLFEHEHKQSVLNFVVQRNTEYDEPVKSKDALILCVGPRRYRVNPIYSQHVRGGGKGANNVHKAERFLRPGAATVATIYGPIVFGKQPCLLLRETEDEHAPALVASGSFFNADTTRINAKRILLTGHPVKIHKKTVTVSLMFFNADDGPSLLSFLWFRAPAVHRLLLTNAPHISSRQSATLRPSSSSPSGAPSATSRSRSAHMASSKRTLTSRSRRSTSSACRCACRPSPLYLAFRTSRVGLIDQTADPLCRRSQVQAHVPQVCDAASRRLDRRDRRRRGRRHGPRVEAGRTWASDDDLLSLLLLVVLACGAESRPGTPARTGGKQQSEAEQNMRENTTEDRGGWIDNVFGGSG
jgi:hypothetical protein